MQTYKFLKRVVILLIAFFLGFLTTIAFELNRCISHLTNFVASPEKNAKQ